jgi:RimJ/RimL family protein N-acetyltransferase
VIELQAPYWWQDLPILQGHSVRLREVAPEDVEALFELLTDPIVSRYISPPPPSATAFEGFITWAHRQRLAGDCVCFAIVPEGLNQAVGLFQVRRLDPEFKIAEWGFVMGAAFWGTGLFQESANLVADFAFKEIGVHRLEARAVTENARGNRVLEKLGARGEAVLHKAFGRTHTQFLWAILAEEWRPDFTPQPAVFDATKVRLQIQKAVAAAPMQMPKRRSPADPFPFFLIGGSDDAPPEKG